MADKKRQSTKEPTDSQKKCQKSKDQVLEIMNANIKKILKQSQTHFELEKRADALPRTHQFEKSCMWWENVKMVIGMGTSLADYFFELTVGCLMVRWFNDYYNN